MLTACVEVAEPTDLSAAGRTCTRKVNKAIAGMGDQYTGQDFVEVGEGGGSLTVSSPVNGVNGAIVSAIAIGCILQETKAPNYIEGRIQEVTGLEGRQEASWGGVTMSYIFDEDNGLSAVLTAD